MIVGDKDKFAIEYQIDEKIDSWILGRIRFWLRGDAVGNWDDAADLMGCMNWLRDFVENPRDRSEPSLSGRSQDEVFHLLTAHLRHSEAVSEAEDAIRNTFSRFNISHLGMSSFDRYDIVLWNDITNNERCMWRLGDDGSIHEAVLPPGEMERVARAFCDHLEAELRKD